MIPFFQFKRTEWALLLMLMTHYTNNPVIAYQRRQVFNTLPRPDKVKLQHKARSIIAEQNYENLDWTELYFICLILQGKTQAKYTSALTDVDAGQWKHYDDCYDRLKCLLELAKYALSGDTVRDLEHIIYKNIAEFITAAQNLTKQL